MDDHVRVCEELFSACGSEFKHLEHYYFHNCVLKVSGRDNRRRHTERIPTQECCTATVRTTTGLRRRCHA